MRAILGWAAGILLVGGLLWTASRNAELKKRVDALGAQANEARASLERRLEDERVRAEARKISARNQENLRRKMIDSLEETERLRRAAELETGFQAEARERTERELMAASRVGEQRVADLEEQLRTSEEAQRLAQDYARQKSSEAAKTARALKTVSSELDLYKKREAQEGQDDELDRQAREEAAKAAVALRESQGRIEQLRQESAVAHYNLGVLYARQEQYREAARELELSLSLRPNDPWAHYNLGLIYDTYLSDPKAALGHYEDYLKLLPSAADAKQVESRIVQMRLRQQAGVTREGTLP